MLMLAATASASLRRLLDLAELDRGLGRQLAVELRIILELLDHRAHQRRDLGALRLVDLDRLDLGDEMLALLAQRVERGALLALDQHAHGAVGQLEQLQHGGDDAEIVERVAVGIVLGRIELRDQEDALVRRHRAFERRHRFVAADEQRHDHLREDDDVAQRQDGIGFGHGNSTGRWPLPYMGQSPAGINEAADHGPLPPVASGQFDPAHRTAD